MLNVLSVDVFELLAQADIGIILNLITNILKRVNRFVWSYSIDKDLSCWNILASFILIMLHP